MEKGLINHPLVSIIIPAYNAENYITDTVNSVLAQTYQHIEVIVVDDGSRDNTVQKLNEISTARQLLIIAKTQNAGAAAARNSGYALSKGSLIKFLDGDDLINPEMIAEQVKLALVNPHCIISGKWGRFYHNDIRTFKLSTEECWQTLPAADWICSSWKNANGMTNPGIFLIPRTIINKAGLWDEALSLLDDTAYFAKTMLAAPQIIFCQDAILYYRSGIAGSLSGSGGRKGSQSAFRAIEKATAALLQKRDDQEAQLCCANIWQLFIYNTYPFHPDLVKRAKKHLSKLVYPSIKFPSGGISKSLLPLLGWKFVKRLQTLKASYTK